MSSGIIARYVRARNPAGEGHTVQAVFSCPGFVTRPIRSVAEHDQPEANSAVLQLPGDLQHASGPLAFVERTGEEQFNGRRERFGDCRGPPGINLFIGQAWVVERVNMRRLIWPTAVDRHEAPVSVAGQPAALKPVRPGLTAVGLPVAGIFHPAIGRPLIN